MEKRGSRGAKDCRAFIELLNFKGGRLPAYFTITAETVEQQIPEYGEADAMSKVLIIADDGSIRAFLAATLIKLGFEVLQAPSGGAGVQMAREQPPDVILCDVNMAGADGLLTLYALRRDEQ